MPNPPVFNMTAAGRGFASRGKGRLVFGQLQDLLAEQPAASQELIVDWSGVNAASPGFIDEFIGLLCPEGESSFREDGVIFAGSNDYITQQIHAILLRRGQEVRYAKTLEDATAGWSITSLGKRYTQAG